MACSVVGSNWVSLLKNSSIIKTKASNENKKKGFRVSSSSSAAAAVSDPYKTLRIQPGASQSEVKKAFRHLALQVVMSMFRDEACELEMESYDIDERTMRGMNDQDWDLWEEWMGWEGAGIRDYSSHINPYI